MPRFFETGMGKRFFEGTVPELVHQLKRLNDNLEARTTVKKIAEILYPGGDMNKEWSPNELDEIAHVLHIDGYVKEKS